MHEHATEGQPTPAPAQHRWLILGASSLGLLALIAGITIVALKRSTSVRTTQQAEYGTEQPSTTAPVATETTSQPPSADTPPLLLKSIGINLDTYDPATGRAGDLLFTKTKLQFGKLWMDYAFTIPSGVSATGQDKRNPQPTFIVPLGTKVHALVDGVVIEVPKLYSNDYSVMIGTGDSKSPWRYELEHVVNVTVKVGDRVKAGDVVAEVANFNNNAPDGFGVMEIGILKGGNPPSHICPFAYLDPSIKTATLQKIDQLYKDWEAYAGDITLYDEATFPIPGCEALDSIAG